MDARDTDSGTSTGRIGKIVNWTAGVLAGCVLAVAGYWITQYGEDTLAELRGKPALDSQVWIRDDNVYSVAFGRGPLSRDDFAKMRLSSNEDILSDLVNSYNGTRAKSLSAQIILTGRRNELTVRDIAVRYRTRRAEPLTGGFVLKTSEGHNSSVPIVVNLDRRNPLFESKDEPGIGYFSTGTYTLKRGERVTFEVEFLANVGYHEFDLEVTYLLADKEERSIIAGPDQGLFKLSGVAGDYRAYHGEIYTFGSGGGAKMAADEACRIIGKSQVCP